MTDATNTQEETPVPENAKEAPQAAPAPESAEKEPAQAETAPEAPEDPSIVGELTPEEQQNVTQAQRQQQNLLLEIGQNTVRGYKLMALFDKQTADFQKYSEALLESKGLKEKGTQYQLMGNGKVRAIKVPETPAPASQAEIENLTKKVVAKEAALEVKKIESETKVAELEAALAEAKARVNGGSPKG